MTWYQKIAAWLSAKDTVYMPQSWVRENKVNRLKAGWPDAPRWRLTSERDTLKRNGRRT